MAEQITIAGKFDLEETYKRYGYIQDLRKVMSAPPVSVDPIQGGSFVAREAEHETDSIQFFNTGSVNVNALNDFSDPLAIIHLAEVATFNYSDKELFSLLALKGMRLDPRTAELLANGRIQPGVFTLEHYGAYEELERFRYDRILNHFRPSNVQARLDGLKNGSWDVIGKIQEFEDSIMKWVRVLDEIPRTPSKKQIRRVELRRKLRTATESWLMSDQIEDDIVELVQRTVHRDES